MLIGYFDMFRNACSDNPDPDPVGAFNTVQSNPDPVTFSKIRQDCDPAIRSVNTSGRMRRAPNVVVKSPITHQLLSKPFYFILLLK